jgi:hypothetical protein
MPAIEQVQTEGEAIVVEAQITEQARTHLSEQEQSLLKELLRPGASIEAVIPPDATAEDMWNTLDACVRGLKMLEVRTLRLKPIIGRLLLMFENKPSLYKTLGYETYSEFMNKGVYELLGLHRTSAYEGKLVARDWPQITPDQYATKIGPKKLNVLSKFTNGRNSTAEHWIKAAETMKVSELQQCVEQRGLIAKGETIGAVITIKTNRDFYARYFEFMEDGRVQSVVGSKSHDKILEAMISEVFDEWIQRHEDEIERKRNGNK